MDAAGFTAIANREPTPAIRNVRTVGQAGLRTIPRSMMSASIWILNLAILAVVLESDLGRRRITAFRLLRPIVTATAIVPFFLHGVVTEGGGAILEVAGTTAGIAIGAAAAGLMRVDHDPGTRRSYSRAGIGYALLWSSVTAGRLFFAYGSQHLFGPQLGRFMYNHQISVDALSASLIMMAVAMILTRTVALWIRSTQARAAVTTSPQKASAPAA